jgi:hypothetical protein
VTDIKFSVPGIESQSASASALVNDLNAIRGEWTAGTADAAPALGMTELINAFESLREAWLTEFGLYTDVVTNLAKSLDGSAKSYEAAEKVNTRAAQAAAR